MTFQDMTATEWNWELAVIRFKEAEKELKECIECLEAALKNTQELRESL